MSDLTEFVTARLDEAERAARGRRTMRAEFRACRIEGTGAEPDWVTVDGQEMRREDITEPLPPEPRVIADIEAKREVVAFLVDAEDEVVKIGSHPEKPSEWMEWGNYHAWHKAAEGVASIYAEHPDYREEWRP